MPFSFSHICDLLQQVSEATGPRSSVDARQLILRWFQQHRLAIDEIVRNASHTDSNIKEAASASAAAILSALLPDLRTDRVYGIQAPSLQRIVARTLGLGHSRIAELSRWTRPAVNGIAVDLADCVESILERTPNSVEEPFVSTEEIDVILNGLAAHCRFSSPAIREAGKSASAALAAASPASSAARSTRMRDQAIGRFYRSLCARDAKWLTRLILKDYRPVVLDPMTIFSAFHPALPLALNVHSDFAAAVQSLKTGDERDQQRMTAGISAASNAHHHCPRLGIKVGRQPWAKARSIKHCLAMGKGRRMSCEEKMDGEYVQVHVDVSKGPYKCLQLFSKSGKDSTRDRIGLHSAIRDSLRLGQDDCKIRTGCILEGEMLAYSEKDARILEFDSVRNHITRSGWRFYCDGNKRATENEHLMIVYYDVLYLDGESMLQTRHAERFRRMEELISCRQGYAEIVHREVIDFGSRSAAEKLRQAFARSIAARQEGLVIKADGDTYFDFSPPGSKPLEWPYMRCFAIKFKRGYVGEFGEVGDFAVVGARYDAIKAKEYPPDLPGLHWTHFYLACREARGSRPQSRAGAVADRQERERFVVTNIVTLTIPQMRTFLKYCRPRVVPVDCQNQGDPENSVPFDLAPIEPGLDDCKDGPTHIFADPPVVDIRCFAFHRQGFGRFWSPRFPSVTKFHFDRTYLDCMTFEDLQTVAVDESRKQKETGPAGGGMGSSFQAQDQDVLPGYSSAIDADMENITEEEEVEHWVTQLKHADPKGVPVDADTSQSSTTTNTRGTQSTDPSTDKSTSQKTVKSEAPREEDGRVIISLLSDDDESQKSATTASSTLTAVFRRGGGEGSGEEKGGKEEDVDQDTLAAPQTPQTPVPLSPPTQTLPILPALPILPTLPTLPILPMQSTPLPAMGPCERANLRGNDSGSETSEVSAVGDCSSPVQKSKKHMSTWDEAGMFPAVSPPRLKRLKSGNMEDRP